MHTKIFDFAQRDWLVLWGDSAGRGVVLGKCAESADVDFPSGNGAVRIDLWWGMNGKFLYGDVGCWTDLPPQQRMDLETFDYSVVCWRRYRTASTHILGASDTSQWHFLNVRPRMKLWAEKVIMTQVEGDRVPSHSSQYIPPCIRWLHSRRLLGSLFPGQEGRKNP